MSGLENQPLNAHKARCLGLAQINIEASFNVLIRSWLYSCRCCGSINAISCQCCNAPSRYTGNISHPRKSQPLLHLDFPQSSRLTTATFTIVPPSTIRSTSHDTLYPASAKLLYLLSHPTVNMTSHTTNDLATAQLSEQTAKQGPVKHWLTRQLSRATLRKEQESGEIVKMLRQIPVRRPGTPNSLGRPSTAPCSGTTTTDESVPPPPPIPAEFLHLLNRQKLDSPLQPSRPSPMGAPNVDAWLDASKPPAALMGGLSYWRSGNPTATNNVTNVQYAIPIIQEPDCEKCSTSHGQQLKSLYRRAKKQVRMPSFRQLRSPNTSEGNYVERSESVPALITPHEHTQLGESPAIIAGEGATDAAPRPSTAVAATPMILPNGEAVMVSADSLLRRDSMSSIQLLEMEFEMDQLVSDHGSPNGSDRRRGALAATHPPREDSMGSFGSSAPTCFSGVPPPSYQSRPASSRPVSILTVSSFGCIDGMNAEYRALSQKKAAEKQRTMKGRLKKLAKKANLTK